MKKIFMYITLSLMLNTVGLSLFSSSSVHAIEGGLQLDAGSAILIEASTGQILYKFNENEALPPASMSKMMTEYLVLDSIKNGHIHWDDVVTVGENAASTIGSRIFLAQGDRHTVEELYIAVAIASANDASVALAEFIAGSEENFAQRMNEKAREIGLSEQAHFINATGLNRIDMKEKFRPTGIQGETLMTAKDAATLALNTLRDHPEATDYSSIAYHQFRPRDQTPMVNLNRMLEVWEEHNNLFTRTAYKGLDGFKTGHTREAGYCFTGTAERDGMRLISVVMNTESESKRFEETQKIMDYGFNNFEKRTILSAKSELKMASKVEITKGLDFEVALITNAGIELMMRKTDTEDDYTLVVSIVDDEERVAPIEEGQVLGTVIFTYDGVEPIQETIQLIAADSVERAGWFRLFMRGISDFFSIISDGIKGIFE